MSFVFQNMPERMPEAWGEVPSLVSCTVLQRTVFNLLWKKFTRLHHNVFYYCYFNSEIYNKITINRKNTFA